MNFISIEFICLLSITFILYYSLGKIKIKGKKIVPQWTILLVASLIFYGFVNSWYLVYLGISSMVSYICAFFIDYKISFRRDRKTISSSYDNYIRDVILMIAPIVINVGILMVLKYYNFFAISAGALIDSELPTFKFLVPLGISFYTFSLVAYNVDVFKGEYKAEKNPFKFILFASYFPKVLQGPIQSYDTVSSGGLFEEHNFKDKEYLPCFKRIAIGLVKKVAIANVLNFYVNGIYSNFDKSSSFILILGSLFYTIQLYCDFSGFLDMVIGVSGLFGIKLTENFDTPYLSSSIQEFWRRWHISLGKWLRNYVYIPLGGNRVPLYKWILNTIIVWFISGIWHGANWTYIIWGLYHGILLVLGKLFEPIKEKISSKLHLNQKNPFINGVNVLKTFLLVNFGWIFFRAPSIDVAFKYIGRIFGLNKGTYNVFNDIQISYKYLIFSFCIIAFLICMIVYKKFIASKFISNIKYLRFEKILTFVVICTFFVVGIYLTLYMNSIGGGESSFIYFDF